jgi:alpha-beta hydrolase superfamily lysophospholipase
MPSIVSHVLAQDGTDLLVRRWPADEAEAGGAWAGPPWGSVLLVHGLGEHSGRYEHVGDQLTAAGLDVAAYDHRGLGGSGGRRGDVERWSRYHDDLEAQLADVRAGARGLPVILYAHSLGGLIAAGYLVDDRPKPDLAILSSPALDSALPGWKKRVAPILARVGPTVAIANGIDGAWLSRDPAVAARTVDDPLCVKSSTARFGALALVEQARLRAAAPRGFGVPTLVLHGDGDRLVPADASAILADAPLVDRRTYPDLRHELHNEPEGPAIIDEIIAWLRERAAGVPMGHAGRQI